MSSPADTPTSRSLIYGLGMLRLFTAEQPVRGIAELAELMNLSRPTAHRYASTCLELGYLEQAPMRRYMLARRAADPGATLLATLKFTRAAVPILRALREETGRTVSLAVLDGAEVLYLRRLCGFERGQYELEKGLGTGSRRPAGRSAAGRALLAAPDGADGGMKAPANAGRPTLDRGGLRENALGLATAVHAQAQTRCAIEITVPADAIDAPALVEELGEPLHGAGATLRAELEGTSRGPGMAGLAH
ncbi:MAG TPA: helix-turn-helix domain-containing protein [Solirubrobacteraceae bacterium]|jgi:IclR family pca regulon transcriptional regulator|nr:helix-turn-helix domain-containing protein [Solirubrobacteraceae bacterium]